MQFDDVDIYLRDNFNKIMSGELDSKFDIEYLDRVKKTSFMLNHITLNINDITLNYNDYKVCYKFNCDPLDFQMFGGDFKTHMFSTIMNDTLFENIYNSFIRDYKIGSILK